MVTVPAPILNKLKTMFPASVGPVMVVADPLLVVSKLAFIADVTVSEVPTKALTGTPGIVQVGATATPPTTL